MLRAPMRDRVVAEPPMPPAGKLEMTVGCGTKRKERICNDCRFALFIGGFRTRDRDHSPSSSFSFFSTKNCFNASMRALSSWM